MKSQGRPNGAPGCQTGAPRSPKVPKRHKNVPQGSKICRRSATMKPQVNHNAKRDTKRPPKVGLRHQVRPQGAKKHVQTTRGRVLAKGDVSGRGLEGQAHQAASEGPVAERKQGFEVQVTSALFLYTMNWVSPLAPTCENEVPGTPQKTSKKP